MSAAPLLELRGVGRTYRGAGLGVGVDVNVAVPALRQVDLRIDSGEMVAILGASGSGKSTLLNILGCLDAADEGQYLVGGVDVASLAPDELARLRRDRFGFVFQRYHLLAREDALRNVEVPAVYAGVPLAERRPAALALLRRLGLGGMEGRRPTELSGGQQQRVSIARALVNGGEVLLADEPTGALDSHSGAEIVELLRELHARGHTVILVTHDPAIARIAPRRIEMRDGRIVSDSGAVAAPGSTLPTTKFPAPARAAPRPLPAAAESARFALRALRAHPLRSGLSVLGVAIGVAAIVGAISLGSGAGESVRASLENFMMGRLTIRSGNPQLAPGRVARPLGEGDLAALRSLRGVQDVTQELRIQAFAQFAHDALSVEVAGTAPGQLSQAGLYVASGRAISEFDLRRAMTVALVDERMLARLAARPGSRAGEPGSTVVLDSIPYTVIGTVASRTGNYGADTWQERIYVPASTFRARLGGAGPVRSVDVVLARGVAPHEVHGALERSLELRHRQRDFAILDLEENFQQGAQVARTLELVLAGIASIALVVGGIGIMNIMLVSVAERTQEIGIHLAVGARRRDIQSQFLAEAVILCALGALAGLGLSAVLVGVADALQGDVRLSISVGSVLLALGIGLSTGVGFGFLPARRASRLRPADALSRE